MFCNKSIQFNASVLAPIQPELEKMWTDIHKGRNHFDLWKHEWTKHGSCARVLPGLGDELKYFGQGLIWQHRYNMEKVPNIYILGTFKIRPKIKIEHISPQCPMFFVNNINTNIILLFSKDIVLFYFFKYNVLQNKSVLATHRLEYNYSQVSFLAL